MPDGNVEVLGDLVGCGGVQIFLSAILQIGEDSAADTKIRAELAAGDTVFGAEGGDCSIDRIHKYHYSFLPRSAASCCRI